MSTTHAISATTAVSSLMNITSATEATGASTTGITQSSSTPLSPSPVAGLGNIMSTLPQSTLLLVGVIVVLVVLLAVITLRRRKPAGPATSTGVRTDGIHCIECGFQNPAGNQFCRKCGAKLIKT